MSTSKYSLTFQGGSCLFGLVQLSMICLAGTLSSQTNQPQLLQTARPWLEDLDSCPNTSISTAFLSVSQSNKKCQALCPRYLGLSLESYRFFWLETLLPFVLFLNTFFPSKRQSSGNTISLRKRLKCCCAAYKESYSEHQTAWKSAFGL